MGRITGLGRQSVRLSVGLSVPHGLPTRKQRGVKTKTGVEVRPG